MAVHYADHAYTGGGAHDRLGTFISRDVGGPEGAWVNLVYESNPTNIVGPFPMLWDTWFAEAIKYSPETGLLQYFVDGEKLCDYVIGAMPPTNTPTIQFGFRAWGWWTGHEQLFDDFVVSQATVVPPQLQLTGMSISNRLVRFVLNGPVGSRYVVEATTNLVNWSPLSTNTIPAGGWVIITDPAAINMSRRFYRAVAP